MLSFTGKRWLIGDDFRSVPGEIPAVEYILSRLSEKRKIDSISSSSPVLPPILPYPDLSKAVSRILRAVESNEKTGIFGDYDCDGITSTALLLRMLRRRGMDPVVRLPHRINEGYGLGKNNIEEFAKQDITLLITTDTGISSLSEVALAREKGMDVIILDHHQTREELPQAFAILHPLLLGEPIDAPPAAAGVAFDFVRAVEAEKSGDKWEGDDFDTALAAIGLVGDMVILKGWNREIVRCGLAALAEMKNGPLASLLRQSGLATAPTSRDLAFRIAPRLNAAGRMAHPIIALSAILGDADAMATLEILNRERQTRVQTTMETILAETEPEDAPFIVRHSEDYSPGLLGLIAGKITETFGRPSMVVNVRGDRCTGSLRGVPSYDVTEALRSAKDLLSSFGGHTQAAGCTFPRSSLEKLSARLAEHAKNLILPENRHPVLPIDGIIDVSSVSLNLCDALSRLEPFGQGNSEPRFVVENASVSSLRCVGKDGTHLQARINGVKAIGFGLAPLRESLSSPVDIACRVSIDRYNGTAVPQILIEDARANAQTGASLPSIENTSVNSALSADAIL